jgi:Glycogen debranching enzyme N terminal
MARKETTPITEPKIRRKSEPRSAPKQSPRDAPKRDDVGFSPPTARVLKPAVSPTRAVKSAASAQESTDFVHFTAKDISLENGLNREWIITNGIGGYGMGSLIGARTRHYHGLLVAALEPPLGRIVTVAQLLEAVKRPDGGLEYLHTQEWGGDTVDPLGYTKLESFTLEGTVPTWHYDLNGAKLMKRIWMKHGENTTFVTYTLTHGGPVALEIKPLCTSRDHHGGTKAGEVPRVDALADGLEVRFPNALPYFIRSNTLRGRRLVV